jgi:4-amino-4-deoxy-L-arabinose transferase-like glycosyltransferase
MKNKLAWILLILVIIIGGALRLWQLGHVPASPDWDEASLGYDAYSILHTGRDQFGKLLPITLRSFNDYKPALYAYLTVPSVFVFGLNVFAVRFPSAIFGILSLIAAFYLVKEIFRNYKYRDCLAVVATFLLAISPWHIQFSRVAFEANVGTALNIFAALFFLKGLRKPWVLSVSAVCAGLAVYAYQSNKAFTPLLILIMVLLFWRRLFSLNKKYLIAVFIVGLIIVLPMVKSMIIDKSSLERFRGTSVFSSQTEILKANLGKLSRDRQNNDKIGLLLDNRRIVYAKVILQGYLSHFDLNWLFIKGDIARHHAHGVGLMYLFELPLLFFGIYSLLMSGRFDQKSKLLVVLWILIAPIPASVTTGVPSAVRTLNFLPMVQVLSALGALFIYEFMKNQNSKKIPYFLILTSYVLFSLFNFAYYINQYFVQSNYYDAKYWQYGYKQAVDESLKLQDKYKEIVVSDDKLMNQSYIFFLFYLKYPPQEYQKIINSRSKDFTDKSFGKYIFRKINWEKDQSTKNVLFIANSDEIPDAVRPITTIHNPDNSPAMKIIGTQL